jgi:hypothetical protein
VNIPGSGYVGVGRVTGRAEQANDFKIAAPNGEEPVLQVLRLGDYHNKFENDPKRSELFVPVEWIKVMSVIGAVKELGFFGNQNTVCKPTAPKWRSTVDRLVQRFGIASV